MHVIRWIRQIGWIRQNLQRDLEGPNTTFVGKQRGAHCIWQAWCVQQPWNPPAYSHFIFFLPEWTLYIIDHAAEAVPEKAVSSIIHLVCLHMTDVTFTSWLEHSSVRRCSTELSVLKEARGYPRPGKWERPALDTVLWPNRPQWIGRSDSCQGQVMIFSPPGWDMRSCSSRG